MFFPGATSVPYGDCLCCRWYVCPIPRPCLASPIPGHALAHPFPTAKPSAEPGTVVLRCEWPYVAVPLPPRQEVSKQPGLGPTPPNRVGSEFTAPVLFWGRRGVPYGDYQRERWRALRGLPTVYGVSAPYGGCSRCRAAPPPEPGERRRSLRSPKIPKSRESTKTKRSRRSSAS